MSNKIKTTRVHKSVIAAIAIGVAAFSGASIASSCKGLENNACSSNASCSWVESYERKDGRKVSAFCRTKPVKKAGGEKLTDKASGKNAKSSAANTGF